MGEISDSEHPMIFSQPQTEPQAYIHQTHRTVPAIVLLFDKLLLLSRSEPSPRVRFMTVPPGVPHHLSTDIFHHLHFLNVLHQYMWMDSYPPPAGGGLDTGRRPLPSMLRH
jgi:hypothetical protein